MHQVYMCVCVYKAHGQALDYSKQRGAFFCNPTGMRNAGLITSKMSLEWAKLAYAVVGAS